MNKRILILPVVLIIAIVIVAAIAYLSQPKAGFPGTSISSEYPLLAEAASSSKPTMIYFSTINCPTCLLEDGVIDYVLPSYNSTHNFVFLKLGSEVVNVFKEWSIMEVPTLIFADKTGTIVKRFDGQYLSESVLRAELERIK